MRAGGRRACSSPGAARGASGLSTSAAVGFAAATRRSSITPRAAGASPLRAAGPRRQAGRLRAAGLMRAMFITYLRARRAGLAYFVVIGLLRQ